MLGDVDLLLDGVEVLDGDLARLLEAVSDFERVDSLVEQLLGLLQDGASQHDDTSGAIADLVVLRSRQLDEEFGSLMVDLLLVSIWFDTYLHLLEDGSSVVRDDDLAVGRHEHLVHASRAE